MTDWNEFHLTSICFSRTFASCVEHSEGMGGTCLPAPGPESSVSVLWRILDPASAASRARCVWAGPERGEGERALYLETDSHHHHHHHHHHLYLETGAASRLSPPRRLVLASVASTAHASRESRDAAWHVTRDELPGDQGATLQLFDLGKPSKIINLNHAWRCGNRVLSSQISKIQIIQKADYRMPRPENVSLLQLWPKLLSFKDESKLVNVQIE